MDENSPQDLKAFFEARFNSLENRLKQLEENYAELSSSKNPDHIEQKEQDQLISELEEEIQSFPRPVSENIINNFDSISSHMTSDEAKTDSPIQAIPTFSPTKQSQPKLHQSPKRKTQTEQNRTPFLPLFIQRTGPLGEALDACIKAYQHYHKQGKAPVFLLSLAGLVAIVLGMVYLLQESFQNLLSPTGKLLVVLSFGAVLVGTGLWLRKIKSHLEDFSTALCGLGTLLFQLVIFFSGPYYELISPIACLSGLSIISIGSYYLAYTLSSRVLAATAFLGALLLPLTFPEGSWHKNLFFPYITGQAIFSVILSWKMKWRNLFILSFTFSTAMIEWVFLNLDELTYLQSFYLQAYFIFFALSSFFSLLKKPLFDLGLLSIHSANLVVFLSSSEHFPFTAKGLGLILITYAVFWSVLFCTLHKWVKVKHQLQLGQALAAGSSAILVGYALLKLISPNWVGPIWALEAIVLLALSLKFKIRYLRFEAWAAFAFALGAIGTELFNLFLPDYSSLKSLGWQPIWNVWLALTAGWMGYVYLLKKCHEDLVIWESKVLRFMDESISVLWSGLFFLYILPNYPQQSLILSSIPMIILLYRSQNKSLPFSEGFALSHYVLLLLAVLIEADRSGTWSFSAQSMEGKIARLESLVFLWFIPFLYQKFYPKASFWPLVNSARISFWMLIPYLYLPKIILRMPEWTGVYLWLMVPVSLCIQWFQKQTVLRINLQLIFISAMFFSLGLPFYFIYSNELPIFISLFLGAFIWTTLYILSKGWKRQLPLRICSELNWTLPVGYFYLTFLIGIVTLHFSKDTQLGFFATGLSALLLLFSWPINWSLRKVLSGLWALVLIQFIALFNPENLFLNSHPLNALPTFLSLILFGYSIHKVKPIVILSKIYGHQLLYLWTWNLILAFQLQVWVKSLPFGEYGVGASLLLIVQASIILMMTLKKTYQSQEKLSALLFTIGAGKMLFIDLASASLAQKTIVFMGLGALLLGAAYIFQNIKEKAQDHEQVEVKPNLPH